MEWVLRYWWAILIFFVSAIIIYKPTLEIKFANRKIQKSKDEQKRIKTMQVEAEKGYYNKGSITKNEFREISSKYEDRLAKAREEQRTYEKYLAEKSLKG